MTQNIPPQSIRFHWCMRTYGPAKPELVTTASCYLLYGWHRHRTSVRADGWSVQDKAISLQPILHPWKIVSCRPICLTKKSHTLWLKLRASSYLPCCFHGMSFSLCVCVCVHAPACVSHPSESVTLLRHSMCPVAHPISMTMLACLWERRMFLSRREEEKKMGLYVTCFSQLKSPVQSGSEVLNLRAFGCFTNMVSRMMLLISVYFFKEKRGMLVAGKG